MTMGKLYRGATCAAAVILAALACGAANALAPASSPATNGELPGGSAQQAPSQQFLDEAAYANRAEIQEGRYVVNHASSSAVRAFAKRMIRDHTRALDQLREVASHGGLKIPAGLSNSDQRAFETLTAASGPRLDETYARSQEQDHEELIRQFRAAESSPELLPALRDYARRTLPTLRQHLRLARHLVEAEANRATG